MTRSASPFRSVSADLVGDPLPGEPPDELGQRQSAGGVEVPAALLDDGEDAIQRGVLGEVGVNPHGYLEQRLGEPGLLRIGAPLLPGLLGRAWLGRNGHRGVGAMLCHDQGQPSRSPVA